jgi:hypothetical protein
VLLRRASAETIAASASTMVGVNPDRRTRQAKKADHKHSAVSGAASHQPEICFVAASTATAVNKTALPRRRAIAYQPANQCRAWSDGPANRERQAAAAAAGMDLTPGGISCRFHRTSMRQEHGTGNGDDTTFGPG